MEFQILVSAGVPTPAAHLLSKHYNKTRTAYYRQLQRASASGDVVAFLNYALQGMADGLAEQREWMRDDREKLVWQDVVRQAFDGSTSISDQRRQRLAGELFDVRSAVTWRELVTARPVIAALYANRTPKTSTRDLNELVRRDLVEKAGGRWRALDERVLGLRPAV